MNKDTGEIENFKEHESMSKHYIEIQKDEMTTKQGKKMKVSKYDNRSKLGKKFLSNRRKRQLIAKMHKRGRK